MTVPTLRFRFQPDTPRLRARVLPSIPPLEASFRSDGTYIQWKLGEGGEWQNLIAIEDIDASVSVGTTTTLPFGSSATVTNSGTAQDVVLDFGIPGATASEILTALLTVDGTGSGLDADTLDGLNSDAFQPIDSDLTAIAGLSTAAYGRSLLTLANATALAAEVDAFFLTPTEGNAAYQPLDSDLTAIAALTTTTYGRSLLTPADAAAARTLLGVGAGTGDLVSTNNLSDVASAVASHDNINTRGSDVASAATLNLDSATGAFVDITGTTAVTAVTLTSGRQRMARASGAFRLTASSTLVVNGSTTASYTTNAGDLLLFEGYGSSVVNVWTIANNDSSASSGVLTKTSGFTVDHTYRGKTIVATSGTFTIALTAAATLGDGFWFDVRNEGTGRITIDPNSSETINGQSTLMFYKNSCRVVSDGTNWRTVGLSQREIISNTGLVSAVAAVEYASLDLTQYSEVTLRALGVVHGTNATAPYVRLSTDGSTWKQGANDYSHHTWRFTASGSGTGGADANTVFGLIDSETASNTQVFSFRFTLVNPGVSNTKDAYWETEGHWSSATRVAGKGSGRFLANSDPIQGIQYLPSSGNISGFFYLDAIRKVV